MVSGVLSQMHMRGMLARHLLLVASGLVVSGAILGVIEHAQALKDAVNFVALLFA